jgi:Flp pilus assembly CpaE family ATPase
MMGRMRKAWSGTVLEEAAEWLVMAGVSLGTLVSTLRLLGVVQ